MERVETLLQKLQQQFNDGVPASQLLLTVRMLQNELIHIQSNQPANEYVTISVTPQIIDPVNSKEEVTVIEAVAEPIAPVEPPKPIEEEKIIEVLQVDEAEIEAELEEIKRNAAALQKMSSQSKPQLLFDPFDDDNDIPTLSHQNTIIKPEPKEINDTVSDNSGSLNDKLKEDTFHIADKLIDTPIKDLKKAIGVNDRFVFINELFRGDEAMYERSIKTINSFSIFPEAEYWIRRELKIKLGWQDSNGVVKQFDQLVRRRFA